MHTYSIHIVAVGVGAVRALAAMGVDAVPVVEVTDLAQRWPGLLLGADGDVVVLAVYGHRGRTRTLATTAAAWAKAQRRFVVAVVGGQDRLGHAHNVAHHADAVVMGPYTAPALAATPMAPVTTMRAFGSRHSADLARLHTTLRGAWWWLGRSTALGPAEAATTAQIRPPWTISEAEALTPNAQTGACCVSWPGQTPSVAWRSPWSKATCAGSSRTARLDQPSRSASSSTNVWARGCASS